MKSRDMSILGVTPLSGVPGGEVVIQCRGFKPGLSSRVLLGDVDALIMSASRDRIIARLPESPQSLGLTLQAGDALSPLFPFALASCLATDLHPVSNPVVTPDGMVITTISGDRGHQVPQPLVRVTRRGDRLPYACEIMNPTGLAFSPDGQLYITSRNDGTVLRYTDLDHLEVIAEDLGIPCGIAFDSRGLLYVGDRTGSIYRVDPAGGKEEFARLSPSISAYHLAMDSEDRLYVTGPTFSMCDSLIRLSREGEPETLVKGLARPQGMAFLPDGDLLVAAGYRGKKGVFRYSVRDGSIGFYLASPIPVGLAVSGNDLFLATRNSIYWAQLQGSVSVN